MVAVPKRRGLPQFGYMSKLMLTIMGGVAEFERAMIRMEQISDIPRQPIHAVNHEHVPVPQIFKRARSRR